MKTALLFFTAVLSLVLLAYPLDSLSQTTGDDTGGFEPPGGIDPAPGSVHTMEVGVTP